MAAFVKSHNARHAKAIGAVGEGAAVLVEAGITPEDEGVVTGIAKHVATTLLKQLAAHRCWERFATSLDM